MLRAGKLSDRTVEVEFKEAAAPVLDFADSGAAPRREEGNLRRCSPACSRSGRGGSGCGSSRRSPSLSRGGGTPGRHGAREADGGRATEQSGIVFSTRSTRSPAGNRSRTRRSRQGSSGTAAVVEGSAVHTSTASCGPITSCSSRGGLPREQAVRPHPGVAGAVPDRVELSSLPGRFRADPDRTPRRADRQYEAMLSAEGVRLSSRRGGLRIAEMACEVNDRTENIGARRLHTVMSACWTTSCSRHRRSPAGGGRHPALCRGAARRDREDADLSAISSEGARGRDGRVYPESETLIEACRTSGSSPGRRSW